jgi:hypothetical protein
MRTFLLLTLLLFLPQLIRAQDRRYPTMDEVGWQINDFAEPNDLSDSDIGELIYLLTLDEAGKVKKIKVIANTFRKKTEKLWRKKVRESTFTRTKKSVPGHAVYQGTLLITRETCDKDPEF